MPDKAYTVSPVITTNDRGEEVISDLSVSSGNRGVGHDGQVHNWQNDYIEDSEGRIHHVFENVELDEDQGNVYREEQYIEALIEANPEITAAQQWAVENLPDEWVEEYDKMIETGDLDELNKAVEWLLEQYASRPQSSQPDPQEVQEEDETEDLTDEEHEILNTVVEDLQQQEAMGQEVAADWQYAVQQAEEAGDDAYAHVAAATAAFHDGDVTAEEAIAFCLENVPLKDLARVYRHMMEE